MIVSRFLHYGLGLRVPGGAWAPQFVANWGDSATASAACAVYTYLKKSRTLDDRRAGRAIATLPR